jgi:hypothetical protein
MHLWSRSRSHLGRIGSLEAESGARRLNEIFEPVLLAVAGSSRVSCRSPWRRRPFATHRCVLGLITRRSQVRIPPPLLHEIPANAGVSTFTELCASAPPGPNWGPNLLPDGQPRVSGRARVVTPADQGVEFPLTPRL